MTPAEKHTVQAVMEVLLLSPRNAFGRLKETPAALKQLRSCVHFDRVPRAGMDVADQCAAVLQVMLGTGAQLP
jgi:hypothetical protein